MSDQDSFIEEVTEALRRERMVRLWRRWGGVVIGGVVLVVAVAAGVTWMREREESAAREAGSAMLAAVQTEGPSSRALELERFLSGREGGVAMVARLHEAAALAETGDVDAALEALDAAAVAAPDPVYAELARFKALMLRAGDMSAGARADAFGAFAGEGAPFRLLALEMRAAALLEAGDRSGARADVDAILNDPLATQDLRQRATVMSALIGGADGS